MVDELYTGRLLELAGNISRIGRLANPDASVSKLSRLCGSKVSVDLKMTGDVVTDFAHEVKACALGQAASAIMAENIIGARGDELIGLAQTMRAMLRENGQAPSGRWADCALLAPIRSFPQRHASTLLTFEAVAAAVELIRTRQATDHRGDAAPARQNG
jgi:NifU-like protein involved in Fe-S cluster formation